MLTGPQKLLHWKRWAACCHSNEWHMQNARLSKDARRTTDLSIYHKLVWRAAEHLALQAHRAVTADDLRHACYLVATSGGMRGEGRGEKSTPHTSHLSPHTSIKGLGNRAFSRVLVLFALLIDPDDLDAVIKWDHPEKSEEEGLDKTIARMAPDAYAREIAARIYGTRLWENLDLNAKRNLRRILGERRKNWNAGRQCEQASNASHASRPESELRPAGLPACWPASSQPF